MKALQLIFLMLLAINLTLFGKRLYFKAKFSISRRIYNNTTAVTVQPFPNSNASISLSILKSERRDDNDSSETKNAKYQKQHCEDDPDCIDFLLKYNNYYSQKLEEILRFHKRSSESNYTESIYNEDNYTQGNNSNDDTTSEYIRSTSVSSDEESSNAFTNLLIEIFQSLTNTSIEESESLINNTFFLQESTVKDPCERWLNNEGRLRAAFSKHLDVLPGCPCTYPNYIFYENEIWDEKQNRNYRWRDVSAPKYRLDVYKPGASFCVRTLSGAGPLSAAAQHCCYDGKRKLITRGSGAGVPYYVSPEVSDILHEKIDILPWRLCKGDFSRFNKVRPPNNDNGCRVNPKKMEYQRQQNSTKDF